MYRYIRGFFFGELVVCPSVEEAEESTAVVATDGVDGMTGVFVFLFVVRVRDALVETAGTSAAKVGTGDVSGGVSRIHLLFFDNLADCRLVETTGDAPAATTTAVVDVDDTTSDTASIDEIFVTTTDEPGIGAADVRIGSTGAIVGGGTDTVAEDRRVLIQ